MAGPFQVEVDAEARVWMDAHPSISTRVIDYDVQRCCGGGKICQIRFRERTGRDDLANFTEGELDDGTRLLIHRRAAARLPARFGLTVRGRGRRQRLDLRLDAEQWGDLLYT